MENLIRDIKLGARSLLRDKGFAATVLLTLAICMAAYTATFAIVHSVLLRPLPVPNADAIVLMANLYPKAGATDQDVSAAPDYYDRLGAVTALQEQAMFDNINTTLKVNGAAEQVPGMGVTPSFFKLVGVAPARGRAFTPEEGEIGRDHEVILSQALWQKLYGGDPSAIGREVRLNETPFTIVGRMPQNFTFLYPEVRFWVPLSFTVQQKTQYHSNNWVDIGRLNPGATIAQVQAQVNALNAANLERLPELKDALINAGFYTKVEPLQHMLVKMALGSTRAGVVRLVLGQGLLIVALGLAVGLAGAAGLQKVIASQVYGVRPFDPMVIGGVTVLLAAIALAACALPTRRATRVDPVAVLKEE